MDAGAPLDLPEATACCVSCFAFSLCLAWETSPFWKVVRAGAALCAANSVKWQPTLSTIGSNRQSHLDCAVLSLNC